MLCSRGPAAGATWRTADLWAQPYTSIDPSCTLLYTALAELRRTQPPPPIVLTRACPNTATTCSRFLGLFWNHWGGGGYLLPASAPVLSSKNATKTRGRLPFSTQRERSGSGEVPTVGAAVGRRSLAGTKRLLTYLHMLYAIVGAGGMRVLCARLADAWRNLSLELNRKKQFCACRLLGAPRPAGVTGLAVARLCPSVFALFVLSLGAPPTSRVAACGVFCIDRFPFSA